MVDWPVFWPLIDFKKMWTRWNFECIFLKKVHQKGLIDPIKENPNSPTCLPILHIYRHWLLIPVLQPPFTDELPFTKSDRASPWERLPSCSGNTTYLFTASQLYTALRFHGFQHASFYNSCKETRRKNVWFTWCYNAIAGYPRGYHYKSSLFGFLLSLPERV